MEKILLVIHLVHEWNIVIFHEFKELKLVFHEAQLSGIQDFNELNEGNMTLYHFNYSNCTVQSVISFTKITYRTAKIFHEM